MWRRSLACFYSQRQFLSSISSELSTVNSIFHPSFFSVKLIPPSPDPSLKSCPPPLTLDYQTALETTISTALATQNTEEAWKSFRSLTCRSTFPNKCLANSLIAHFSSFTDIPNLKRAFVSVILLAEKNPKLLDFESVRALLSSMCSANSFPPVFDLLARLFQNRFFVPFSVWGDFITDICEKNGCSIREFLGIFNETSRITLVEKLDFMKPDLRACNLALRGCCFILESVSEAERIVENMSLLGVMLNEFSFGFLVYLYALKGLEEKLVELERLMDAHCFPNKNAVFFENLISGYAKSGKLDSLSGAFLNSLRVGRGLCPFFGSGDIYCTIVEAFLRRENLNELANLITEAQKLEPPSIPVDRSSGFALVNACVNLSSLQKANTILLQMKSKGGVIVLGVYKALLKANYSQHRISEAAQLVSEIRSSNLQLDVESYNSLIDASMSWRDFDSAFSLFRDMKESGIPDLKQSYLTIVTVLLESNSPHLMYAFLDEVSKDSRVGVGTHDWNSLIHAFCKLEMMEDARGVVLRMSCLGFVPNSQTYLSLVNGYARMGRYFDVVVLWHKVKEEKDKRNGVLLDEKLVDAFVYSFVKGGFFDLVMQIVERCKEWNMFVDKWKYKHVFIETLKNNRMTKRWGSTLWSKGSIGAFKTWVGLS